MVAGLLKPRSEYLNCALHCGTLLLFNTHPRSPRASTHARTRGLVVACRRKEGPQTSAHVPLPPRPPATRSLDPRAPRFCLSSGDWSGPPAKRTPSVVNLQRDLQLEREKHRRTQESVEQLRMEMQMMGRLLAAGREQLVSLGAESLSPDISVLMPQEVRRHPESHSQPPACTLAPGGSTCLWLLACCTRRPARFVQLDPPTSRGMCRGCRKVDIAHR